MEPERGRSTSTKAPAPPKTARTECRRAGGQSRASDERPRERTADIGSVAAADAVDGRYGTAETRTRFPTGAQRRSSPSATGREARRRRPKRSTPTERRCYRQGWVQHPSIAEVRRPHLEGG